jgi:hypothetical protein
MKYEWKKADKDIYLPKQEPIIVNVPTYKYYTIAGKGNPNNLEFSERVGALYNLCYGIKMMPKKGITPTGYYEYSIFPLEATWTLEDNDIHFETLDKDKLVYKLMIRQPDFVTNELAMQNIETMKQKKPNPYLQYVVFEEITDGKCVQILHIGSYDDEPPTFDKMNTFIKEQHLEKRIFAHKEIYLGNPLKTKTENLKTVLRYYLK